MAMTTQSRDAWRAGRAHRGRDGAPRDQADLERLRTEMQRLKFTLVAVQLTGLAIILAAMRLWM